MELQQWKQNFIRDYLDEIDSLEVMDKLEKYTKRILNKKPVALSPIASVSYTHLTLPTTERV